MQWKIVFLAIFFFSITVKEVINSQTTMYSIGENVAAYIIASCSISFLIIFFACYMRRSFQILLIIATIIQSVQISVLLIKNSSNGLFLESNHIGWIDFGLLILFFVLCLVEWRAKKLFFGLFIKWFIAISAVYGIIMLAAYIFAPDSGISTEMYLPFSSLLYKYPIAFNELLSDGYAIAAMICVILNFLKSNAAIYTERGMLVARNEAMKLNLRNMESNTKQAAKYHHEMKHHISALQILLNNNEIEQMKQYLENLNGTVEENTICQYTEHILINAILSEAAVRAKTEQIKWEASVSVNRDLEINDNDICSLLSNMVDNAIRACQSVDKDKRYIKIKINQKGKFLAIACVNSKKGATLTDESGKICSNRKDTTGHGYGISIMQKICESYHSALLVEYGDDSFTVKTNLHIQ